MAVTESDVVVFGATGFTGSRVAKALLRLAPTTCRCVSGVGVGKHVIVKICQSTKVDARIFYTSTFLTRRIAVGGRDKGKLMSVLSEVDPDNTAEVRLLVSKRGGYTTCYC
jgi:short subunit dehydrogenase-like uncharacterized protein